MLKNCVYTPLIYFTYTFWILKQLCIDVNAMLSVSFAGAYDTQWRNRIKVVTYYYVSLKC